jgi:hypothetical protein
MVPDREVSIIDAVRTGMRASIFESRSTGFMSRLHPVQETRRSERMKNRQYRISLIPA